MKCIITYWILEMDIFNYELLFLQHIIAVPSCTIYMYIISYLYPCIKYIETSYLYTFIMWARHVHWVVYTISKSAVIQSTSWLSISIFYHCCIILCLYYSIRLHSIGFIPFKYSIQSLLLGWLNSHNFTILSPQTMYYPVYIGWFQCMLCDFTNM